MLDEIGYRHTKKGLVDLKLLIFLGEKRTLLAGPLALWFKPAFAAVTLGPIALGSLSV